MTQTGRVGSDDLIFLTREPINAETPLDRQVGAITPVSRHYVRDHFPIPDAPARIAINGAVRTPLDLGRNDLRSLARRIARRHTTSRKRPRGLLIWGRPAPTSRSHVPSYASVLSKHGSRSGS